jgi:hypothetical protein
MSIAGLYKRKRRRERGGIVHVYFLSRSIHRPHPVEGDFMSSHWKQIARSNRRRVGAAFMEGLERRNLMSAAPTTAQLDQDASDAYIYGLAPLVFQNDEHTVTFNKLTNLSTFPGPGTGVAPNADTLYSIAYLNLAQQPIVLHQANTNGRYVLFQLLDAYTNTFASLGSETTGTQAQNYLIAGPNWFGAVPAGTELVKAPTNNVWVIGRTQTLDTPTDIAAVNALQAQYSVTPLSLFLNPSSTPPATLADPATVTLSNAESFYTGLAAFLRTNPPPAADGPILQEFAQLGLGPADQFNWNNLSSAVQQALTTGFTQGQTRFAADVASGIAIFGPPSVSVNGWNLDLANIGTYGTDYDARAVVAVYGIGANPPADAVYPSTSVDVDGNTLDGTNNYVLHFDADQLPPANAFWSVTVYQNDQFYANSIDRYSTGSLHPELQYNSDGSVDIYLQNTEPASGTSNWLPVPAGKFTVTLRIYWPQESVLDGDYAPPGIVLVPPTSSSDTSNARRSIIVATDADATAQSILSTPGDVLDETQQISLLTK